MKSGSANAQFAHGNVWRKIKGMLQPCPCVREDQAFFLTLQTSPMTGEIAGLGCFGGLGVVSEGNEGHPTTAENKPAPREVLEG